VLEYIEVGLAAEEVSLELPSQSEWRKYASVPDEL
jgi:hypothetical protein